MPSASAAAGRPSNQNNHLGETNVTSYDTANLTDEELAKKAQEELNMEGDMEEVRSFMLSYFSFFK